MAPVKNIQVFETANELAEAACRFTIELCRQAVKERGRFSISLSGGSTPDKLYALLAQSPYREEMDWANTYIFWGDERCVPLDDKQNNARQAKLLLLAKVPIPASNIFRIPVDLPPAQAADEYEQTIKNFFGTEPPRFDLVLLGLGEDGHTASLFPNTPVLTEMKKLVKEVYLKEQDMYRVTMTYPLLNAARNIVFLVAGAGKASILRAILDGSVLYPAQLVKPTHGTLYWMADKASMPES